MFVDTGAVPATSNANDGAELKDVKVVMPGNAPDPRSMSTPALDCVRTVEPSGRAVCAESGSVNGKHATATWPLATAPETVTVSRPVAGANIEVSTATEVPLPTPSLTRHETTPVDEDEETPVRPWKMILPVAGSAEFDLKAKRKMSPLAPTYATGLNTTVSMTSVEVGAVPTAG